MSEVLRIQVRFSKGFGQIALSAGYTSYTNCREGIEGGGTMKLERKVEVTPHKREIHTHPAMEASSKYVHAEGR